MLQRKIFFFSIPFVINFALKCGKRKLVSWNVIYFVVRFKTLLTTNLWHQHLKHQPSQQTESLVIPLVQCISQKQILAGWSLNLCSHLPRLKRTLLLAALFWLCSVQYFAFFFWFHLNLVYNENNLKKMYGHQ